MKESNVSYLYIVCILNNSSVCTNCTPETKASLNSQTESRTRASKAISYLRTYHAYVDVVVGLIDRLQAQKKTPTATTLVSRHIVI